MDYKLKGNHESFQDMQEKLQKQAAQDQADMIQEMDDIADDGAEDDEEALRRKEEATKKRA